MEVPRPEDYIGRALESFGPRLPVVGEADRLQAQPRLLSKAELARMKEFLNTVEPLVQQLRQVTSIEQSEIKPIIEQLKRAADLANTETKPY